MARTSSSSSSRSSSKTTPTITPKPSPPQPPQLPPPAPHTSSTSATTSQSQPSNKTELGNKSSGGGFMSSVMDGFGFGFGSSIAHRVVGGIFGSPTSYPHTTKVETHHHHHHSQETHIEDKVLNTQDISKPEYISKPECKSLQEEYLKCIQSSNTDFQSSCDFSLNIFKDCETNFISFN